MTEAEARRRLVENIHTLLREWQEGHGWQWHKHPGRWFSLDLDDSDIPQASPDARSLWAAWWFLDAFLDAMIHGFPKLDSLSWEEAVRILEYVGNCLEQGLPIENGQVMTYAPRRKSSSQTLLRAASAPEVVAEELLRPVQDTGTSDPQQLLRPDVTD